MMSRVRLSALALLAVLAVGTTGCSSEEPPPLDDGSQTVPLAGLGPQVEDAGVEVLSTDMPVAVTTDEVVGALEDAGVTGPAAAAPEGEDDSVVAFDPTATAGLLGLVLDEPGSTLVLVFATPEGAAVFAAGDPEVFADAASEDGRKAFLAGNLVGYAATDDGRPVRLRRALNSLGGAAS